MSKHTESALFSICNETLEQLEDYNYLGQVVCADYKHKNEIQHRIGMDWGALANPPR